jgi:exopolyphosphatase / guanosine-5'-triphosphate,3'-diphosphate pyrophosphatase
MEVGGEAPRLGALDIGSNSIRLVVAEVQHGGTYRVLDEERDMTRLGRGLAETGRLADETLARGLEVIGKMKAIAQGFGVEQLRAVATSAVREAENGEVFRREAWRRYGVRVEIISAEEEARLAFVSATRRFDLEGRAVAVTDIGGGSLEVVLSSGAIIDQVHSLDLGAVRLTERFVHSDPLRKKHWRALQRVIDRRIKAEIGKPPFIAEVMVGSGGTFSALAGMARWEREGREGNPQGYLVTRAEVVRLLARLLELPLAQRRELPGLPPARADIIVAGAAVVARLAKHLGCQQILVNDGGVRDGLLLAMIAGRPGAGVPASAPEGRLGPVRAFARKCRANERHGEHVAVLAGEIFDGVQTVAPMPAGARELLIAAALVHDVGFLINHSQHHKHAYHLIMHSDLAGFSSREIELLANVVRYHRRALPAKAHANFARLDRPDRKLVRQLAGILRIAVALNRSHTQSVVGVRCHATRERVRLTLLARAEPQVELWDVRRKLPLFEKAFGVPLELRWATPKATRRPPMRVVRGRGRGTARA